jgi:hypothetical protein
MASSMSRWAGCASELAQPRGQSDVPTGSAWRGGSTRPRTFARFNLLASMGPATASCDPRTEPATLVGYLMCDRPACRPPEPPTTQAADVWMQMWRQG